MNAEAEKELLAELRSISSKYGDSRFQQNETSHSSPSPPTSPIQGQSSTANPKTKKENEMNYNEGEIDNQNEGNDGDGGFNLPLSKGQVISRNLNKIEDNKLSQRMESLVKSNREDDSIQDTKFKVQETSSIKDEGSPPSHHNLALESYENILNAPTEKICDKTTNKNNKQNDEAVESILKVVKTQLETNDKPHNQEKHLNNNQMLSENDIVSKNYRDERVKQSSCVTETPSNREEGGFKSQQNFKGERGGVAEDADLLAELRAISSKSKSSDRFSHSNNDIGSETNNDLDNIAGAESKERQEIPPWKKGRAANKIRKQKDIPPWKKGKEAVSEESKSAEVKESEVAIDIKVKSQSPQNQSQQIKPSGNGFKSSLPQTFKGDRGGAAEDADLLAELQAISSKSTKSRFTDQNTSKDQVESDANEQQLPDPPAARPSINANTDNQLSMVDRNTKDVEGLNSGLGVNGNGWSTPLYESLPPASSSFSVTDSKIVSGDVSNKVPTSVLDVSDSQISIDEFPGVLSSKNWKTRKAAYIFLCDLFLKRSKDIEEGSMQSSLILESLDDFVLSIVKDSNASALDAGLELVNLYAIHCVEATSADKASNITSSLLSGSALSSSRPSTTKMSKALILKLMEVGLDIPSSLHAVVNVLLEKGIVARKPKVVITSSALVLDAAKCFGAAHLPLATVSSSVSKMLSHANAAVRDTGINILAEICRATGSKNHLKGVIDKLKSSQVTQLDKLLEEQSIPMPPTVGFRCQKSQIQSDEGTFSPENVIKALEASTKEDEKKRYAARPEVDIFNALCKTEYAKKIQGKKWSEKVDALNILIECGGERPFKLMQPTSSSSKNYAELIRDMKRLLSHTHFAVNSKAMEVLEMFSEGVGEKLYPNLRPLLLNLTNLAKDKKLTTAVARCLDSLFGNVLSFDHLLDQEDAIPDALDEKKQKNALSRKNTLEFLHRCIQRGQSAGSRGELTASTVHNLTLLLSEKVCDSDASVRKASLDIFICLLCHDNPTVLEKAQMNVEILKGKNPRAFKSLSKYLDQQSPKGNQSEAIVQNDSKKSVLQKKTVVSKSQKKISKSNVSKSDENKVLKDNSKPKIQDDLSENIDNNDNNDIPSVEDAINDLSLMAIPKWDLSDDDEGVLAGLKSSAWKSKKRSIDDLEKYVKTLNLESGATNDIPSVPILVVVKAYTKNFKESNIILMKSIMELFSALFEVHKTCKKSPQLWICKDVVRVAVEKISDRKFSQISPEVLTELCTVRTPSTIIDFCRKKINEIKSPPAHEALLKWCISFCKDFGVGTISACLNEFVTWIVKESESSNPKVRQTSLQLLEEVYIQVGPAVKILIQSLLSDDMAQSLKKQIEKIFDTNFDPSISKVVRSKVCVTLPSTKVSSSSDTANENSITLEIPRKDLVGILPNDCITRLGSKEGKTAWKIRKEALEEISTAVGKCGGLILCNPSTVKSLVELLRALRDRLSDSQSNLKPLAAGIIGSILGGVDVTTQAKLGKIIFLPLISAAINDNKKPMREASLNALSLGTQKSELEGGGTNELAMASIMNPLVVALGDSEYKAGGLPEMIAFVEERASHLPKVSSNTGSKLYQQQQMFAVQVIACLTSSKVETRAAAEALLRKCIAVDTLSFRNVEKGIEKLLPAQQRTVSPIIKSLTNEHNNDKEQKVKNTPKKRNESRNKNTPLRMKSSPNVMEGKKNQSQNQNLPRSTVQINSAGNLDNNMKRSMTENTSSLRKSPRNEESRNEGGNPLQLKHQNMSMKSDRSSPSLRKKENWPEHPEEPNSFEHFASLRKNWHHLLYPTANNLFPDKGLRKQEDAIPGLKIIEQALDATNNDHVDSSVIDQLDLIFKWLVCAICSREHTAGLQAILSLLLKLFEYLTEREYQLTDFEASILLPHVLEKASIAKGRFGDLFHDLLSFFTGNKTHLYSIQKYGQLICIPLVEKSGTPKTRCLAMRECRTSIDDVGLNAIGKKGIILIAKSLSVETLAENRIASLDIFEAVLKRMNGDIQKLFRVCGKSNISRKAKDLVEERWAKHNPSNVLDLSSDTSVSTSKENYAGVSNKKSGTIFQKEHPSPSPSSRIPVLPKSSSASKRRSTIGLDSSIPVFNLPLRDNNESSRLSSQHERIAAPNLPNGPFTFKYHTIENKKQDKDYDRKHELESDISHNVQNSKTNFSTPRRKSLIPKDAHDIMKKSSSKLLSSISKTSAADNHSESSQSYSSTPKTGAAASLRARLQQIRDKHRNTPVKPSSGDNSAIENKLNKKSIQSPSLKSQHPPHPIEEKIVSHHNFDADNGVTKEIQAMLDSPTPLQEGDLVLQQATVALRKLHASISRNSPKNTEIDQSILKKIRNEVLADTSSYVFLLTSTMSFGFGYKKNSGISIHILSVTLAALMAIFRDSELSYSVSENALRYLIEEAAKALLDPRLGGSSELIDTSTSTQLVKAINKLAIQTAIGSNRQFSFQALISLQLKFASVAAKKHEAEDQKNMNSRLSRIVTKLFIRVTKLEVTSESPFFRNGMDFIVLIKTLQEMLVSCDNLRLEENLEKINDLFLMNDDVTAPMGACTAMAKILINSILKTNISPGQVREAISSAGFDENKSLLGRLLKCCVPEHVTQDVQAKSFNEATSAESTADSTKSTKIAALVSEVGKADEGVDRRQALIALRNFSVQHDIDITIHLAHLSAPFRAFILKQMKLLGDENDEQTSERSDKLIRSKSEVFDSTNREIEKYSSKPKAMSERIRYLKSKLNATEAAVHSAMGANSSKSSHNIISHEIEDSSSTGNNSKPISSIRMRLASAQEQRARNGINSSSNMSLGSSLSSTISQGAALRARLEAAKRNRKG